MEASVGSIQISGKDALSCIGNKPLPPIAIRVYHLNFSLAEGGYEAEPADLDLLDLFVVRSTLGLFVSDGRLKES